MSAGKVVQVAANDYGMIGIRIADAVAAQDDMLKVLSDELFCVYMVDNQAIVRTDAALEFGTSGW